MFRLGYAAGDFPRLPMGERPRKSFFTTGHHQASLFIGAKRVLGGTYIYASFWQAIGKVRIILRRGAVIAQESLRFTR
jgi:hypothetical protein